MCHRARDMLREAKLPKSGSCETNLERWYRGNKYRKSVSDEGWTEEKIEDHSHEATPEERRRREKNWKIVSNKGVVQSPMRQRPDFREAKHAYRRLYKKMFKVPDKETSQSIQYNKEGKIPNNNLMNTRSTPGPPSNWI